MLFLAQHLGECRLFSQLSDAIGFATKHVRLFPTSHVDIYEMYIGSPFDFTNLGTPLHTIRP